MIDIFLSYAHEDKERIKPLVQRLEERGWVVWWDTDIHAGVLFDMEIESALKEARCVLVIWSKHSISSQWVRSEAHEGMDRNILVPLLIDDVRPPVPFAQFQAANYTDLSTGVPLSETGLDEDIRRAFSGQAGPVHISRQETASGGRWRPVLLTTLFAALALVLWSRYVSISPVAAPVTGAGNVGNGNTLSFEARDRVVIASVQNLTGDEIFDNSIEQALKIGLSQSRFANIVSDTEVQHTLERMKLPPDTRLSREVAIEVALRELAKAVTIATITKVGDLYSIAIEIVNPANGQTVFADTVTSAKRDGVVGSLGEATRAIRSQLGESLGSIEDSTTPLEKVTTADLEALKAYSTAINQGLQDELGEPIQLLLWAVERDPEFAMAHAKLGALYATEDYQLKKAEYHWALALKHSDRLTQREKVYIQASSTWNDSPPERIRAWKLMSSLFPDEAVGHHNLGMVYWEDENYFEEAAEAFHKAIAVNHPWNFISMHMLGYVLLGLGETQEAEHWFRKGMKLENNPLDYGIVDVLIVAKRHEEAGAYFDTKAVSRISADVLQRNRKLVGFFADQGRLEEAAEVAKRQLLNARNNGLLADEHRSAAALLAVMERSEDRAEFDRLLNMTVNALLQSLKQKHGSLRFSPVPMLALIGKISARNGNIEMAQAIMGRIQEMAKEGNFYFRIAYSGLLKAEIHLLEGNAEQALNQALKSLERRELFQAHETLARAYEQLGDIAAAIEELQWMIRHHGRAFAENLSRFYGKEFNVLDWTFAHYHLGRLYESVGDNASATRHYEAFVSNWRSGDSTHWALIRAQDRLASLE